MLCLSGFELYSRWVPLWVVSRQLMVLYSDWLLVWLVNYVATLLVVYQLSRDVIGYEDS